MRSWTVHLLRWSLLVVIVLAIREQHARSVADERGQQEITASLRETRELLPSVAQFGGSDPQRGGLFLVDAAGQRVGFAVQTSPAADAVIGFAGPNNVLLVFDSEGRLAGLKLLASEDTEDHVELVQNDTAFFHAFEGMTWEELASRPEIDGVSGATLTSAAIIEGIVRRLGGSARPNFLFPEPITVEDATTVFPEASRIEPDSTRESTWMVFDRNDKRLGYLLRTSPHSDNRIGYQGPTDGLLALDPEGRAVIGIGVNASYETPQYVEDVTLDWTFMHRFDGMPLDEFAQLAVGAGEDIEGVSGATMTSQVLVENLIEAAERFQKPVMFTQSRDEGSRASFLQNLRLSARDIGTAVVVLFAGVIAFTDLRGKRWLRRTWQVLLIVYLGFVNADLLSQALLVGWASNGLPWTIAPGLILLTFAAFAVPLTTKTQLYCHHLCPHGAAQELLRNRLPWRLRMPRWLERGLSIVPTVLLTAVAAIALFRWPVNLAGLEAFDAYAFRAAAVSAVIIAIGGLIASLFVPMAYCRYGCPTGALLGYLRKNARSGELTLRDAFAALLAFAAALIAWA